MTYWSRTSLISWGEGTWVIASATSRSSSSARISLQSAMHSLQMYTDGPEMNFRTESLDFPQNEQRRCLSCDMAMATNRGDGLGPGASGPPRIIGGRAPRGQRRVSADLRERGNRERGTGTR